MPDLLKTIVKQLSSWVVPKKAVDSRYSLMEQTNFNSSLLLASLIALLSSAFNYWELSNITLTIFTIALSIVFYIIYYLSRYKDYRNIWLTSIVILAFLSLLWFMNGGGQGSVTYIYLLALILLIIIAKKQQISLVFIIFIADITILYVIEYFWGNSLIHPYPTNRDRYIDITFVFIIVTLFAFFMLRFFKSMYENEREKVEQQKAIIEQQNKNHLASLTYASNLQRMIISNEEQLQFLFSDFFVLFKPKDIVSGDFYWAKQWEEIGIIIVADCTGHGVPAALLSILGIAIIEETFEQMKTKDREYDASEFLELLRIKLFKYMQKRGQAEIRQDSIDMGIVIINYRNSSLQFSGANRSLMLIRENQHQQPINIEKEATDTHSLYSYPATKNTIGYNYIEKPFTNHKINYCSGDTYYLLTDGYGDQFDSMNKKKFKVGRLKTELLKMQALTMETQSECLLNLYQNWKKDTEQTDDILIIGLRI